MSILRVDIGVIWLFMPNDGTRSNDPWDPRAIWIDPHTTIDFVGPDWERDLVRERRRFLESAVFELIWPIISNMKASGAVPAPPGYKFDNFVYSSYTWEIVTSNRVVKEIQ
ncbi:hypothetical protein [Lacticaseibacillus hegangensis]|uniref:Uncharacterized protein n=1 Tax=Lacticaseibacillus hegangensis TaxID=2486010 RepID=A0ABW4CY10_9LACO|nr:hypothetical protein [Lacticaseibacillus hegangensis]